MCVVYINNSMSKFDNTLQKYHTLLEFGKSSETMFAAQGGTGINLGGSPIRPYPGTLDTGDMEKHVDKTKIKPGTARSVAELQLQDNEGLVRVVVNKLANKLPLTQAEQEIVSKIKFLARNKNKDLGSLKPSEDKGSSGGLSKALVSDEVEMLNDPNRPRMSYAQA